MPPSVADSTPRTTPLARPAAADPRHGVLPAATAWTLALTGAVGLVAAFVLLVEKVQLLKDPAYVPSCSINPVLSCGSIMSTDQASAFGFPNPMLGLVGFTALTMVGVIALTGAALPRWFWRAVQAGTTLGVIFVHWLIFQSLYRIGALCPYCMAVWVVTITAFVATTAHTIRRSPTSTRVGQVLAYAPSVVVVWVMAIAALATVRFWDYWATLAT